MSVSEAALWALIAICFVLVGAVLTPGTVSVDQRAAVLAGVAAILLTIGWRVHRTIRKEDDE
jgi:hypothetical protein